MRRLDDRLEQSRIAPPGPPPRRRYRKLLSFSILSITLVSVMPLILVTWIKHREYEKALNAEQIRPIARLTANAKLSLESFLSERLSALSLVVQEKTIEELRDPGNLKHVLRSLKRAFGGFTDLGLINGNGLQVSYAGPYNLQGKSYKEQDWCHEVAMRGVYVSDVFMGYRKFPHFVIAIRHDYGDDSSYLLRATIESEAINKMMLRWMPLPASDAFLITHKKVLQTPSRHHGDIFSKVNVPAMPYSNDAEIIETTDERGDPLIVGYAYVSRSPFIAVLLHHPGTMHASWLPLRRNLVIILLISTVLIIAVVVTGSAYMVRRVREADTRRTAVLHKVEYTNRMAVIGRLAAGVAHEINNPLAIISEKAGLLSDLFRLSDTMPSKEKILKIADAISKSVERCSAITHRLLGFAKHMDVRRDQVNLSLLIEEVLGFLDKEAHYRGLHVALHLADDIPFLESDRGQLQQLFLNIINNAFAAVDEGGEITIDGKMVGDNQVEVSIADNGIGIPEENLQQIFEPFFTTKDGSGTGLGLSITYGIVEKLGGKISVTSKVNKGTCFRVTLPITRE
ncbi:MAG: ATP-binding protein [Myxococcota bacterium]|nr:ATP-binding protein [Myxococcota bacterium]